MKENENNILLGDSIIKQYDYEKSKINLQKLIDYYFVYELEFHYINPPTITPSYEIRYDSNKDFIHSSKTENYIIKKIDQEERLKEFYDSLYTVYNKLRLDELKFFKLYFLKKRPEYEVMELINANRRSIEIIKRSCVIKFAIFFNIAVRK